jgi:hypothetical protein
MTSFLALEEGRATPGGWYPRALGTPAREPPTGATAAAKEARAAELEVDEVVVEGPAADVLIERA